MKPSHNRVIAITMAFAMAALVAGPGRAWAQEGPLAVAPPLDLRTAAGRIVEDTLVIDGRAYGARWYLPDAEPAALALIEHGFTRRCANLHGTTEALMAAGLMALCLDASMAGGNPALADALAGALLAGLVAPDGRPVPPRVVVGGHSAGAAFAVRLGWALTQAAPERVAGALLFDPVAADGFEPQLRALAAAGERPLRVVSANAAPCNAQHNAYPALRAVRADALAAGGDAFVGLQLVQRSTHVDAEGGDTDALAIAACGQGRPQASNVRTLRELAAAWALDLAIGLRQPAYYPGGRRVETLRALGVAVAIE